LRAIALRLGHRLVQLDQRIAGADQLTGSDQNRRHAGDFERLHHLGAQMRDDLAGGDRDDVHLADNRPAESRKRQQTQGVGGSAAERMGRRFCNLQRRGQECALLRMQGV
jgi:hypothetical protein